MARDKYLHETPLKDGVFEFIMDMQKRYPHGNRFQQQQGAG